LLTTSPKRFIARGSLGSLVIRIGTVGLAFISQVLLARLMGAESYGLYVYALTGLNFMVLAARLGLDGLLTRFAAAYAVEGKWGLLRGLIGFGYRTTVVAASVLGLVAWCGLAFWRAELPPGHYGVFLAILWLLPPTALLGVGQGLLLGLKHPWQAQLPEPIARVLMLLMVAAIYWHQGLVSPVMALSASGVATTAALLAGAYWLHRAVPSAARSSTPVRSSREWLTTAVPLLFMAFTRLALSQGDILLVAWLLGEKSAGLYAVATRLAELTTFGLQAANTTLAPLISELHTTRRTARLQGIIIRSARGIFAFTTLVSLGLAIFGEPLLRLFGAEFASAYQPLLILLIGQTVNAATGPVGYLMTMTGHQQPAAWRVGMSTALTLTLDLILIPRLGLEGAAMANALGMTLLNLSLLAYVIRRLSINPTIFGSTLHEKPA